MKDNIRFEDFPKKNNNVKNKKKTVLIVSFCILIVSFLLILTTYINIKLFKIDNVSYSIKKNEIKQLLENTGFNNYSAKTSKLNAGYTYVHYANKKLYKDRKNEIWLSFNQNNEISYLKFKLVYKKNDFSIKKVLQDSNNVLGKFSKLRIDDSAIKKAKENLGDELKKNYDDYILYYKLDANRNEEFYFMDIILERF